MTLSASMSEKISDHDWLAEFHDGESRALEGFYREHFATVDRTVGRLLSGPDRETVVHEVFFRIISNPALRRAFHGGSASAWITTVARNHTIDFCRRHQREVISDEPERAAEALDAGGSSDLEVERKLLLEQFCRDVLPAKWRPVFEACFLEGKTQRDAARALGISRTTLLYQQHRVRALLEKFLLEDLES